MDHDFTMTTLMNILAGLVILLYISCVGLYVASILYNRRHDRERLDRYRCQLGSGFWGRVALGCVNFISSQLIISLTYVFGNLPYLLGKGEGPQPGLDGEEPVILVHGLFHNSSAWMLFKRCLKREGYGNTSVYGYNSFTRTYADLVHELTLKMEQVLKANPGKKIALVGHSLGGLIIRGAIADERFKGRLAAVVTLGTPHQGSELARLGIGRLARQLCPTDPIFEQLAAQKPVEGVAKLSLHTPLDNMVFPTRLLEIAEPGWQQECLQPSVSHQGMVYDRAIFERVLALFEECRESGWFDA